MTLLVHILQVLSDYDHITIEDRYGNVIYEGLCRDFRENPTRYFNRVVTCIRTGLHRCTIELSEAEG